MATPRDGSYREAMRKAFIGSEALAEAGLVTPKRGLPGGSGVLDGDEKPLPPVVETMKANDDAKRQGVMVALMLGSDTAEQLAVDGGEPASDLHLTLAYLGKLENLPDDVTERASRAVSAATKNMVALKGKVSGMGRFNGSKSSDGKDVVYASFDSPELSAFREKIVAELEKEGVSPKNDHGFTPHITLAYVNREAVNPVQKLDDLEMTFKSVALVIGNQTRQSFALAYDKEDEVSDIEKAQKERREKCGGGYYGDTGVHGHVLIRNKAKTANDGSHTHTFMHPNGMMLFTSMDGAHEHAMPSDDAGNTNGMGGHKHAVKMYDGLVLETEIDGDHSHEALLSETTHSGAHVHVLKLPDGTVLKSMTVADQWEQQEEYRRREAEYAAAVQAVQAQVGKAVEKYEVSLQVPILKADEEQRLVTGIVLEPDEVDAQNDTITADVIEKAAHNFLARYNRGTKLGVMHKIFGEIGVELVESFIAREDMELGGQPVKKGSWLMTVKILEEPMWKKVKSGEITGFSIGGVATVV